MVKPVIALASLLGGTFATGLVLYIQVDPSVLTTPTELPNTTAAIGATPPPATREVPPSNEPGVITLEPVEIKATPSKIQAHPKLRKVVPPLESKPCSGWRDLGPKSSDAASGTSHRVRELCVS